MEHEGAQAGNVSCETRDDVLGIGTHRRRGGLLVGGGEGGGLEERESQPHGVGGKSKALLIRKAPSHTQGDPLESETNARKMLYPFFLDKVCPRSLFRWRY
ncbi:hypothetical protein ACSQ67_008948 [Phaseolus vulgaris]